MVGMVWMGGLGWFVLDSMVGMVWLGWLACVACMHGCMVGMVGMCVAECENCGQLIS